MASLKHYIVGGVTVAIGLALAPAEVRAEALESSSTADRHTIHLAQAKAESKPKPASAQSPGGTPEMVHTDDHRHSQGRERGHDLPTTKSVISNRELENQNAADGTEAVKGVAGVTAANAKTAENSSINVRGIQLNLYTSYRLNGGLPTAGIITTPLENKERIETLKGANALMFGIASPGGIVNMVTKRATDTPVRNIVLSGSGFGAFGGAFDVGQKFGSDGQFGARINGSLNHLENGVDGAQGIARFISGAFDYRVIDPVLVKLDLEYYDRDVVEQAGLAPLKAVNGKVPIPRVPDARKLLSGNWAHYTPTTFNWDLRVDYNYFSSWTLIAEVGRSYSDRSRFSNRITKYNLTTGEGNLQTNYLDGQNYINKFQRLETVGSFGTWIFNHDLTVGVAEAERDFNNPKVQNFNQAQNAYDPIATVIPTFSGLAPTTTPQISRDIGVYTYDTVSFLDHFKLLAGFRETYYHADNTDSPGGPHTVTNSHTPSPAYGAIWQFARGTEAYASYMQGLEETGQAPIGTVNQYQILPPAVALQKEIGVRSSYFKWFTGSISYFNITRANATTNLNTNTYLLDGQNVFKGVELTTAFTATRDLSFTLSGQYLQASEHPVFDVAQAGKTPENTPKVSGNFGVNYKIPTVRGLVVRAGTSYVGPRFVNDADQGQIPGVELYNMGIGYSTKLDGHATSFQMTVDNLANKHYWNSATTSQFGAGMDRSFRFNARYSF